MSERPVNPARGRDPARDASGAAALLLAVLLAAGTALTGRQGSGVPFPAAPPPPLPRGAPADGAARIPPAGVGAAPNRVRAPKPPLAGVVDLNRADAKALTALPGVGERLAGRIVAYRASHGPFRSPEELRQVPGVGPKRLERIRPFLRAGEGG